MQRALQYSFLGLLFWSVTDGALLSMKKLNLTSQNRNILQFGYLIMGAAGNPLGYNGYGCWYVYLFDGP